MHRFANENLYSLQNDLLFVTMLVKTYVDTCVNRLKRLKRDWRCELYICFTHYDSQSRLCEVSSGKNRLSL